MHVDLTDPATLKRLLKKQGVQPSRYAGQNFLVCPEPVEAIIAGVEGGPEHITELGTGAGPLTLALLAAGFSVRAIERDAALAAILQDVVPKNLKPQLQLTVGDLRTVPWQWEEPYQLVGNIPYNLSGLILRRITQLVPAPTTVIIMVQREVAQRMAAQVPDMNLLGLAVQLWGSVHPLLDVPASCFWPEPQVDSTVVMLVPYEQVAATVPDREAVLTCAKSFFQHKRKQMGGILRRTFQIPVGQLEDIMSAAGIHPDSRPQEVSVAQWQALTQHLTTNT